MNQFLAVAYIPLLISCALRAYLAHASGAGVFDVRTFSDVEIGFYLISLTLAYLWYWHRFVRKTCPRCGSYAVRHLRTDELNQYHTVRKVTEKDNHGQSVTRHLNVTIAEMREHLSCDRGHTWSIDFTQEKK